MKKVLFCLLFVMLIVFSFEKIDALEKDLPIQLLSGADSGTPQIQMPIIEFGKNNIPCNQLLGSSMVTLIKSARVFLQFLGVGIAVLRGMMSFLPAITNKDPNALQKAFKQFTTIMIVLVLVLVLPSLVRLVGKLFELDLSCI